MHKYGETQLMQIQENWISDMKLVNSNDNKQGRVTLKANDLHRRVIGIAMTQMSKEDKYAQVSVSEGIKCHGEIAIADVLTEFSQLND